MHSPTLVPSNRAGSAPELFLPAGHPLPTPGTQRAGCQPGSTPVCPVARGEDLAFPFPPRADDRCEIRQTAASQPDICTATLYNPVRQLQRASAVPRNRGGRAPTPTARSAPKLDPGDARRHQEGPLVAALPSMLLGSLSRVLLLQRTPSPLPSIQT